MPTASGGASCAALAIPVAPSPVPAPEPTAPADLVQATIPLNFGPETIATGFDSVWVAAHRSNTIFRVDPGTNTVIASIPITISGVEVGVGSVFVGPHGVWVPVQGVLPVGANAGSQLFRIEPSTNKIDLMVPMSGVDAVVDWTDAVWARTDPQDGANHLAMIQIDPATGTPLRTVDLGPGLRSPKYTPDLAYGLGSLWAAVADDELVRIDPSGNIVATIRTPAIPQAYGSFAFADQHMYFTENDATLARIDPTTNCVDGLTYLGRQTSAPAFGAPQLAVGAAPGGLYVGFDRGGLALVDPATLQITDSVRVDTQNAVGSTAFDFGSLWFPTFGNNTVLRLKPLS
jgi:YVTN family beta-propeller protein